MSEAMQYPPETDVSVSRMQTSGEFAELIAALAEWQLEATKIVKDKLNNLGGKYADLGTIIAVVNPELAKHGLFVTQHPVGTGDSMYLETTVFHKSGQWMRSMVRVRVMPAVMYHERAANGDTVKVRDITPQQVGSALTYYRRYALAAILNIVIDEDDDGNKASGRRARAEGEPTKQPPQAGSTPTKVEPLSDAKIIEIINKIAQAKAEDGPKMEKALTAYGVSGAIDKKTWGDLVAMLMERVITEATPVLVSGYASKLREYRAKGLLSDTAYSNLETKLMAKVPGGEQNGEANEQN